MNNSAKNSLILSQEIYKQLLDEAEASYPNECVGLVFTSQSSSDTNTSTNNMRAVALTNVAINPQVTYQAEPLELLQALKQADETDADLVAIYHSHPNGPNHPSETDLAKAYYDVPALIILPKEEKIYGFVLDTKLVDIKKEDDQSHPQKFYELDLVVR